MTKKPRNPRRLDVLKTAGRSNAAAVALGRRGGQANTKAQNDARAVNAQKGGRPKRVCAICGQPVLGGHVDRELDDTCGPVKHGFKWERAGHSHQAPSNPLDEIAAILNEAFATAAGDQTLLSNRAGDTVKRAQLAGAFIDATDKVIAVLLGTGRKVVKP